MPQEVDKKPDPKPDSKPEQETGKVTVYTGGGGGEKQVDKSLIIETQNHGLK